MNNLITKYIYSSFSRQLCNCHLLFFKTDLNRISIKMNKLGLQHSITELSSYAGQISYMSLAESRAAVESSAAEVLFPSLGPSPSLVGGIFVQFSRVISRVRPVGRRSINAAAYPYAEYAANKRDYARAENRGGHAWYGASLFPSIFQCQF